ncbi:MAG TPA: MarR family transcriptional regulator [Solirubrobacteraceae bacterium]|nr:MarR family transcriptional regulator [Solirubrobacteraceae bacterium]
MSARGEAQVEDRWEHWLVHLLWNVSTRTSALGEAALEGTPLTLAGLGLLENVSARPGITIAGITRRAPQTQQALSQIAARLEKLGLIERRVPRTGRGVSLHLTAAGARARRQAHDAIEAFESDVKQALRPARHEQLTKLLEETKTAIVELAARRRATGESTRTGPGRRAGGGSTRTAGGVE